MMKKSFVAVLVICISYVTFPGLFQIAKVYAAPVTYLEQNFNNFSVGSLTKDLQYEQFKFTGDYYIGETKREDGNTYVQLSTANTVGKVIYALQYSSLNNITYSNYRKIEYDFKFGGADNGDVYLLGNHVRAVYDTVNKAYFLCLAGASTGETLTFNTSVSIDTWHKIKIFYYANGNNKKIYSIDLDGQAVDTLISGEAYDYNSTSFTAHGSYMIDFKYSASGAVNLFQKLKAGYLAIDNIKYTDGDFNADIEPASAVKMTQFPIDGKVKIKFYEPPVLDTITNDTIQILKNGTEKVEWTDGYYLSDSKEYVIDFGQQNLEFNTRYQVKLMTSIQTNNILMRNLIANTSSFITDGNKLLVQSLTSQINGDTQKIDFELYNKAYPQKDFTVFVGVYLKENQSSTLISYEQLDKSIDVGETDSVTCSVSVPDTESQFYIKVFLWDNATNRDILADALVIGQEPIYNAANSLTDNQLALLDPIVNVNEGHFLLCGKYSVVEKRNVNIAVLDPNGQVVYLDQKHVDDDGYFGFDFYLKVGSMEGNYTYVVKNAVGDEVHNSVFLSFSTAIPILKNVTYGGVPACDTYIQISYKYIQFANYEEKSHMVEWLIADSADGAYTVIGTEDSLYLKNDYIHKYLKYTIAVTSIKDSSSILYISEPVYIYAVPKIKNIRLKQKENRVDVYYDYSHILGFEEYNSSFKWYISDKQNGSYELLTGKEAAYLNVSAELDNKYVKVEITPRANAADALEKVGASVMSESFMLDYRETESAATGRGSSLGNKSIGNATSTIVAPIVNQPTEPQIVFADVSDHWAKPSILQLYDKGIIKGKTESEFDPDGKITRAEFVAMLVRALGLEIKSYDNAFSDVNSSDWYANLLQTAYDNSILNGADGNANPMNQLSRQEMAVFVVKTYEALGKVVMVDGILDYQDATLIASWARSFVGKAKEINLMQGMGNGNFEPIKEATRAEACIVLQRLIGIGGITSENK